MKTEAVIITGVVRIDEQRETFCIESDDPDWDFAVRLVGKHDQPRTSDESIDFLFSLEEGTPIELVVRLRDQTEKEE